MSDTNSFLHFVLLMAGCVLVAWLVSAAVLKKPSARWYRAVLCAVLTTVLVHLYLLLRGLGPDQFALVSIFTTALYGLAGGLMMEGLRALMAGRNRP